MANWHRVYQQNTMIGWAWTGSAAATFVTFSCTPTRGIRVLARAPTLWGEIFRPAPKYVGRPTYYHLWNRVDGKFLGWFWIGHSTAQVISRFCPNVDVVTPQGMPVT
jgi:hypothetical protein